jgi:hypothetical protein
MRHSWKEKSRSVALCCRCGLKRIIEKQSGPWRSSTPDISYHWYSETHGVEYRQGFAGPCDRQWPESYQPELRAAWYKKPKQLTMF